MAEVSRVAVLGAAGFLGNRAVEMLRFGGNDVVPIVRSARTLALASRFPLDPMIADALDRQALTRAFRGCDQVVVAIASDPATIVGAVEPVYRAADDAGVRRIVYLSSAAVHGQSPAPGTDESSPLPRSQPFPYNRAKAVAERRLLDLRSHGRTEVVLLRPAIVHGPRSQWTGGLADQLLAGHAFLADGGNGICNSAYVDNVVHAIVLSGAADADRVDGEAFLIGDAETVTWRQLVAPVASALGIDVADLPTPPSAALLSRRSRPATSRLLPALRHVFGLLPRRLAVPLRAAVAAVREERAAAGPGLPPETSRELALLHSCRVRLPYSKAEALLGYRPLVDFEEACRRSIAWLDFAGYPVR